MPDPEAAPCAAGRTPEVRETVTSMLVRIGDKWSMQVVAALGSGPVRFNELHRRIADISHKMLSVTLKELTRDGLVDRTVTPTVPPQVEYALTELGRELLIPVAALTDWTAANTERILAARVAYDDRRASLAG